MCDNKIYGSHCFVTVKVKSPSSSIFPIIWGQTEPILFGAWDCTDTLHLLASPGQVTSTCWQLVLRFPCFRATHDKQKVMYLVVHQLSSQINFDGQRIRTHNTETTGLQTHTLNHSVNLFNQGSSISKVSATCLLQNVRTQEIDFPELGTN